MKILITGAHFTPAQAVVEQLKKKPRVKLVYVGRRTTLEGDSTISAESKILPLLGVKFIPIITGRLQRSFTLYTIPSLLKIPIGFIQALYIILSEKPDAILSFGGYVAVPVIFAGWLFSVPVIVHEQTLVSGLANKISSFFADKIALSFKPENRFKDRQTIVTGNPIRSMVLDPRDKISGHLRIFDIARKEKLPIILITGGNQGSHILNITVEECIEKLTKIAYVIHITGDNKFKDFARLQKLQNERYLIKKWIGSQYGAILSKVDLVVSRAGINTLTELAYMGKPALVIPIPYQDEQNENARVFQDLGLVRMLSQSKLSGYSLLENIKAMVKNLDRLKKRAKKAKSVIIPDAAKRLALQTILLATKTSVNLNI